jgi:predicted metalloprotease with PDZ domain
MAHPAAARRSNIGMKAMTLALLLASAAPLSLATAQDRRPVGAPPTPPIPAARDIPYPGVMKLSIDATDIDRRIFKIRQTVPVAKSGRMTLLYPKWVPGGHSPRNSIDYLAGLTITANGQPVAWTRDPVEVFAFHFTPPVGAKTVDVAFEILTPVTPAIGRILVTPEMLSLQFLSTALYPAGYYSRQIPVEASVKLPTGWGFGTALTPDHKDGDTTTFKVTSFETLIDSPMVAGKYYKQYDLAPGAKTPVMLNVVADRAEQVEASPEALTFHRNLVAQAVKLYGSQHYDHYEFLLSLSDNLGGIGLEHHRSSENGAGPKYFTDWATAFPRHYLLAHEYTHSWNGKFRRGADLWTPTPDAPMRDSLLWVYEGQTQYWGYMLAARSGLMTKPQVLDVIAGFAATYDTQSGRAWRPLVDTTNDPIIANRKPLSWRDYTRSEDYYSEGALIWLDADTLIREKTGGKKSLDDFAHAFFSPDDGSYTVLTYTFDDVVKTLNGVVPYDWATFLKTRVNEAGHPAPLDGIARGGYKLVYTDVPSDFIKSNETTGRNVNMTYSLGFTVGAGGVLSAVQWGSPAFDAGVIAGATIVATNGEAYDADKLKDAVKAAAKPGAGPIELLVRTGDRYKTVKLDYHGGLRYPKLEKVGAGPAALDAILAARD